MKVSDAFKNGKSFMQLVTGGDPDLGKQKIIREMEKWSRYHRSWNSFSDPIAEGPVIQEADLGITGWMYNR